MHNARAHSVHEVIHCCPLVVAQQQPNKLRASTIPSGCRSNGAICIPPMHAYRYWFWSNRHLCPLATCVHSLPRHHV